MTSQFIPVNSFTGDKLNVSQLLVLRPISS